LIAVVAAIIMHQPALAFARARFEAAEDFRCHHPEHAGSGNLLREVCRQAADFFHLSCAGSEFGQERLKRRQRINPAHDVNSP
jgi:hypothetical protein